MNFNLQSIVIAVDEMLPTQAHRRQRGDAHRTLAEGLGLTVPTTRTLAKVAGLPPPMVSGQPTNAELSDALGVNRVARKGLFVVMDFGAVDFVILRETFLDSLGLFVSQLVAEDPKHSVVVLLFSVIPPRDSLFWRHLDRHNGGDGIVAVTAPEGKPRVLGGHGRVSEEALAELGRGSVPSQAALIDGFRDRIVRHLGHFDLDGSSCSQYRWEAPYSGWHLTALIAARVRRAQEEHPRNWKTWIAIPSDSSSWLEDACVLAADRVGAELKRIPADARPVLRQQQVALHIFVDVVSRGRHLENMYSWARRMPPESVTSMAVFAARDYAPDTGVQPDSLVQVPTSRVSRDTCPQCAIGLAFTNSSQRYPLGIRTFDMWTMMREAPWERESYGPESQNPTWDRTFPSMERMLKTHGAWVAWKLQDLMDHVAGERSVSIVAPDEPAIRYVLRRLPAVQNGTLVPVFIDRVVLDLLEADPLEDARALDKSSEWGQQLDFLATRGSAAVVCDEFMSSGSTFRAMRRLLANYNLTTFAFIPVINRSGERRIDGTPVYSLYELPWLRGERLP